MAFELSKLPYTYEALEPFIDAQTMNIHHTKHHQAYVTNLNAALEKYPDLQAKSIDALIADINAVPADIRAAGGVARMSDPEIILRIMDAVSIPVMAKCRIGHFVEAQVLEALGHHRPVSLLGHQAAPVGTPSGPLGRGRGQQLTDARGQLGGTHHHPRLVVLHQVAHLAGGVGEHRQPRGQVVEHLERGEGEARDRGVRRQPDVGGAVPKIENAPWPAFPADVLSIALVVATQARGTVLIHDKLFESRLYFTDKLITMGAQIILCDPHRAVVVGPSVLRGSPVVSPDIRAGMALVIAALCAEGVSEIGNIGQIDRGYEQLEKKLLGLGARIERRDR